mgnify:FL=1
MNVYSITKRTQGNDGFGHYNKVVETNLSLYTDEIDAEEHLKQLPVDIKTFVNYDRTVEELPMYFITKLFVNEGEGESMTKKLLNKLTNPKF